MYTVLSSVCFMKIIFPMFTYQLLQRVDVVPGSPMEISVALSSTCSADPLDRIVSFENVMKCGMYLILWRSIFKKCNHAL